MKTVIALHSESDSAFLTTPDDSSLMVCTQVEADHLRDGDVITNVGLSQSTVLPSMDFETYSESGYNIDPVTKKVTGAGSGSKGGLLVVGTPVYAEHPSTDVICLYYDLKDGKGRRGWMPNFPPPQDLLDHVAGGGMVEAFNFTFEFWIWNLVCVRKYGWPTLQLEQGVCVMARARRFSLAGSLANCAKALGTVDKDKEGKRLIQKLCRPHTPTKSRKSVRHTIETAFEDYAAINRYCDRDVKTEDEVAARIPDMTEYERATWLQDQLVNVRGVQVDVESLDACLRYMEWMQNKFTLELAQITGGAVGSGSEVAKMIDWLATQYVHMPSMGADDVKAALMAVDPATKPEAYRVLEIRQALASANIKKLPALKQQLNTDGRLRDQYMYCGADRTGRWSAGGVQLQNITSKGPKSKECQNCGLMLGQAWHDDCPQCGENDFKKLSDWTVEAVEMALHHIKTLDPEMVFRLWGDPSTLLGGCLRGLFVAKPDHRFICCDFSAIEAVVAACLSRCEWRIEVFQTHGKIYELSAAAITGKDVQEYFDYKEQNGFDHPDRKKIGKVAELASGYGGWIGAWRNFGAEGDDNEVKKQILAWRDASPEIVEMWGGQFRDVGNWNFVQEYYGLEGAAIQAILNPNQCFSHIDITYAVYNDILFCRLPSGRFLHYHAPRLANDTHKLAKKPCYKITFEGYNSNPTKGPIGWVRMETYGGRLFENVVQAVSADIQAEALVRVEKNGYPVVMHTHDEIIGEVPKGQGSVDEMAALMCERPTWAQWWPLRAAGWEHRRYQKD